VVTAVDVTLVSIGRSATMIAEKPLGFESFRFLVTVGVMVDGPRESSKSAFIFVGKPERRRGAGLKILTKY
jgi:hypothetical protein